MFSPAQQPTFYFIGVTTAKSSIMKVFPKWAEYLGLKNAVIKGMDFVPHDEPKKYYEAVEFIKNDPLSLGALVTTHKLDLFSATKELFDEIDPLARLMGEVSSISKRGGKLIGHAKDPITSGLSLDDFLPKAHFEKTSADVFCIGAGGSAIAISWHLLQEGRSPNRPRKIIISDTSSERLTHIQDIHQELKVTDKCEYHLVADVNQNDALLHALPDHSVVINATGLGKDAPGSPLSSDAKFPNNGIVWELNYRGDLIFLDQAKLQRDVQNLQIEDGWVYFIHGWTQVIAEVFDIKLFTSKQQFEDISRIAAEISGR